MPSDRLTPEQLADLEKRSQTMTAVLMSDHTSPLPTDQDWREAIERFRVHLRATGRESDDDVILELMDYLAGFCGPIPGRGALRDRRAATAADSSSEP